MEHSTIVLIALMALVVIFILINQRIHNLIVTALTELHKSTCELKMRIDAIEKKVAVKNTDDNN